MLILTRGQGKSVTFTIGDITVVVSVEVIRPHQVKLGFEAPPEVNIVRTELIEKRGGTDAT